MFEHVLVLACKGERVSQLIGTMISQLIGMRIRINSKTRYGPAGIFFKTPKANVRNNMSKTVFN